VHQQKQVAYALLSVNSRRKGLLRILAFICRGCRFFSRN